MPISYHRRAGKYTRSIRIGRPGARRRHALESSSITGTRQVLRGPSTDENGRVSSAHLRASPSLRAIRLDYRPIMRLILHASILFYYYHCRRTSRLASAMPWRTSRRCAGAAPPRRHGPAGLALGHARLVDAAGGIPASARLACFAVKPGRLPIKAADVLLSAADMLFRLIFLPLRQHHDRGRFGIGS